MPNLETLYHQAYELHYVKKDLVSAHDLYKQIIALSPTSAEGINSGKQIERIESNKLYQEQMVRRIGEIREAEINKQLRDEREEVLRHGDAQLYEKFTKEITGANYDPALWSKALSLHYGDEAKAKWEYVKLKVEDTKVRLGVSSSETSKAESHSSLEKSAAAKPLQASDPVLLQTIVGNETRVAGDAHRTQPMFCIFCGASITEAARFCQMCGKELSWPNGAMHQSALITNLDAAAHESISTIGKTRIYPEKSVNWYMVALTKYLVFEGRARRKEYWYFLLFSLLLGSCFGILDIMVGTFDREVGSGTFTLPYLLATFIPGISVTVRRLHDTDRSGWWWLLGLIPVLGGFVLLAFASFDGTPGSNKYGPDPKSLSP